MKTAFPFWENRIAPVFDTARQVYIVEMESGRIVREDQEPLTGDLPVQKALRLAEFGVGTLICGAISRPLQEMVTGCGIRVIPFVAGGLREVVHAWSSGGFDRSAYAMHGCFGRRHRQSGGMHSIHREGNIMSGMGQGGMGMGGGQGQGQGGQGAREPAAEAARWLPDRTEIASVPSAVRRCRINAVCPTSSANARNAGP